MVPETGVEPAPTMYGEDNSEPGYAALGRIMAVEYFKGILDALEIEYKQ